MITKEEARENLNKSLKNLYSRQGNITARELEKEVIYMCCYEIIKKRKKKTSVITDMSLMEKSFNDSLLDIVPVSNVYAEAATELFPKDYDHTNIIIVTEAVKNNIFEDNMWDILRDYYLVKHGYDIDYALFEDGGVPVFKMRSLKQIENINRILYDRIDITISFIDEKRIFVTIDNKINEVATNIRDRGDWYNIEYENENYKYIIRYDESFNPSSFVAIKSQDHHRVEYFEK